MPGDTTDTDNEDCASGLTFHISPQICTETVMTTAFTGVLMVIDLPTLFKYCTFFLCYPETPLNEHQIKYYIYSFPLILTARRPKLFLSICGFLVMLSCWRSLPLSPNVAMPQFVIIGAPLLVMRRVIGSWKEIGWWRGRRWNCSQIDPHHAITHWANWSDLVLIEKQKTFPFQFW